MTRTFADITVGSLIDGDMVTAREVVAPAAGDHAAIIRITTASGGRRTEAGDFDISGFRGFHPADPTLVNVPDADMHAWAKAVHDSIGVVPVAWVIEALHGVALEMNRRRALEDITAASEPDRCPGHYDDDHALLHGEYFCDGTCQ